MMKLFLINLNQHTKYLIAARTPDEALDLLIDKKQKSDGFYIDEYDVEITEYPIANSVICEVDTMCV